MSKFLTNIISLRARKLSAEYKALYDKVVSLNSRKKDLELQVLAFDREIFSINRKLDKLEEKIIEDIKNR